MVNIAAIRSVSQQKMHQNAFAAGVPPWTPLGELPRLLVGWEGKHPTMPTPPRRLQRLSFDTLLRYTLLKVGVYGYRSYMQRIGYSNANEGVTVINFGF